VRVNAFGAAEQWQETPSVSLVGRQAMRAEGGVAAASATRGQSRQAGREGERGAAGRVGWVPGGGSGQRGVSAGGGAIEWRPLPRSSRRKRVPDCRVDGQWRSTAAGDWSV